MKAKDFMGQNESKVVRRSHVIEKIKRISISMDKGEAFTMILLIGLFAVMVIGLVYYLML